LGGFLGELSQKLADRWLTLLVLPGAFYLAVIATAHALGQGHALDVPYLVSRITGWAKAPVSTSAAGQVVLLTGVLAAAAGAGLAAQAAGSVIERLTLAAGWRGWPWPLRPLAGTLTDRRSERWNAAHRSYHELREQAETAQHERGQRPDPAARYAAYRARMRVGLEEPDRPTWCGDRINAASIRVARDLNINLPDLWPVLWLHLPDGDRAEITTARADLTRATTLAGWAVLYAPLVGWWWPAGIITITLAFTAWHRSRDATDTYAHLLEAATRLRLTTLATQLGITPDNLSAPALGATITHQRLPTPPPAPALSPATIKPPPPNQAHPISQGTEPSPGQ
jgi:hypothetical protein